jgi:hypothetical protein
VSAAADELHSARLHAARRARERLPRLRQSRVGWPRSAECRPGHREAVRGQTDPTLGLCI